MKDAADISYVIDGEDRVASVNSEWSRFAAENDVAEVMPEKVIGRTLWDFIADEATQELYRHVLDRVRSGQPIDLTLRCDSPDRRRLIEMSVISRDADCVEFRIHRLCEKPRLFQALLAASTPRSHARVLTCGWCNRFHAGTETWLEVEEAVAQLELTEEHELPRCEYVVCPDCFAKVTELLARKDPLEAEGLGAV